MWTYLLLGLAVGLRHALEADHVAAVASLATRGGTVRSQAAQGAIWGLGHALTLLFVGGTCLAFGWRIPPSWDRTFEGVVGVVLVALGLSVWLRLRRNGLHVRGHRTAVGAFHVPLRALFVGSAHGLAGSAALVVVVAGSAPSSGAGFLYLVLFGAGSLLGMVVLAATISAPMRFSARVHSTLCGLAGSASLWLGATRIWAFAAGTHS